MSPVNRDGPFSSFGDLDSSLFLLQKFRCVDMRRWARSVIEISVNGLEIFPIS